MYYAVIVNKSLCVFFRSILWLDNINFAWFHKWFVNFHSWKSARSLLNPLWQIVLFFRPVIVWFRDNSVNWILLVDDLIVSHPIFLILTDIPIWSCLHYWFCPLHIFRIRYHFWYKQATASTVDKVLEGLGELILLCSSLFANNIIARGYAFCITNTFFDSPLAIDAVSLSNSIDRSYQFLVQLIIERWRVFWIMHWDMKRLHFVMIPWFLDVVVGFDNHILLAKLAVIFDFRHDSSFERISDVFRPAEDISDSKSIFSSCLIAGLILLFHCSVGFLFCFKYCCSFFEIGEDFVGG